MKTETRTLELFIADDGTEFTDEEKCRRYEIDVLNRRKNIKYYRVNHSPDLTEGRGYYAITHVAIEEASRLSEYLVRDWCQDYFGRHVAFVMGVQPMPNWIVSEMKESDYLVKTYKGSWGDMKVHHVFLSFGGKLEGYPDPQPLWEKKHGL